MQSLLSLKSILFELSGKTTILRYIDIAIGVLSCPFWQVSLSYRREEPVKKDYRNDLVGLPGPGAEGLGGADAQ